MPDESKTTKCHTSTANETWLIGHPGPELLEADRLNADLLREVLGGEYHPTTEDMVLMVKHSPIALQLLRPVRFR